MILSTFYIILMIISFGGVLTCAVKKDKIKKAKQITVVMFVILFISSTLFYFNFGKGSDIYSLELQQYKKAEAFVLCSELAKQMPGAKVLVIINEEDPTLPDVNQKAQIEGLKEGFGDTVTDIKIVEAPRNKDAKIIELADGNKMIESIFWRAQEFNELVAQNRDRDLIISLSRLPDDLPNVNILKSKKNKPKFTFTYNIFSSYMPPQMMFPLVYSGLMPAIVVQKPDYENTKIHFPPSDLKACFDKRFILINKENLEQVIKKYPQDEFSKVHTYY